VTERSRLAMGSELRLTGWTADEPEALAAFDAAFAEFDRLDALMSVWKETSEIQRLNRAAGQHPVPIAKELGALLDAARQVSEWTNGAFDVTFGALSGLWRFDHDQDETVPAADAIGARLGLVDYRALELDPRSGTAFLRRTGMRAHLGGIGKGYAVDRAADILRSRGLDNVLIQSGGDLYVAGRRGDRPWRVGIRDPRGPAERSFASLDLSDGAISTSGDYERFFFRDGRRYHHIIDPSVGWPAQGTRSVTIVADTSVLADALSTGVFVMGPVRGMALIERLPGVEGVIVSDRNEVTVSSGLKGRLIELAQPTDSP
jgi:thiamine biosynthesis lipoprotein